PRRCGRAATASCRGSSESRSRCEDARRPCRSTRWPEEHAGRRRLDGGDHSAGRWVPCGLRPPQRTMELGQVIADRFEIGRPAGPGGMGQVFFARDLQTGEPVAIKVMHRTGAMETERFAREAAVLSTLRHPGIVRYIGGGATPVGAPYLVMEWLEG